VIFGRPETLRFDENEMESLVSVVDGIGVSAMADWDFEVLSEISDYSRKAGKSFALHCSEVVREEIDAILDLKPSFLVHMIQASYSDMEKVSAEKIPIVTCPSANTFFDLRPPLEKMIEADVRVCLGTDNAMLTKPDMFSELRRLRSMFPEETLSDTHLVDTVLDNGRKTLNSILGLRDEVGEYPEFILLDRALDDPYKQVLQARAKDIHSVNQR
jgi:cytosine/adenosine deaminase-related metal-dependent hydrolase